MDWIARGLGLFYLLGGLFAVHAFRTERLLDSALAALDPSFDARRETLKTNVLLFGSVLTVLGGLALLLLWRWTPLVFAANLAWQGGFLLWAARTFPPENALEQQGRQRTTNAFFTYFAATAFVVWLSGTGRLA